jgi:hypothetical protein
MATSQAHYYDDLTQKLRELIRQRFRTLLFENGTLVPTDTDLEPGVREISEDILTGVGEAALLAPGSSDIPLVQVSMTEDRYPVVMAVSAYSIEWQERRAFERSGVPIRTERINFARRAIAEALNKFGAYGNIALSIRGLLNNANVTLDNNSFNPNTATFAEWVTFVIDAVLRLGIDSDMVTYATDVLLSPRMYAKSQQVSNPDNPAISVLQAVRDRLRDEENISQVRFRAVPECSSARLEANGVQSGGTNKDRILVYNLDPMCVQRQIEQEIAAFLPQEYVQVKGTTQFFPMFSCASATKVRELPSIRYIDVAKVA